MTQKTTCSNFLESQDFKFKDSQGDSIPIDPPPAKRCRESDKENVPSSSQILSTFSSISQNSFSSNHNPGIRYPSASFLAEISKNRKRDLSIEEASRIMAQCASEIVDISKNARFQALMVSRLKYDDDVEKSGTVNREIYEKQLNALIRKKFEFNANKRGMKRSLASSQNEP